MSRTPVPDTMGHLSRDKGTGHRGGKPPVLVPSCPRSCPAELLRSRHAAQEPGPAFALLTAKEVADLLRTSRKAVYAMAERRQLPGAAHLSNGQRRRASA